MNVLAFWDNQGNLLFTKDNETSVTSVEGNVFEIPEGKRLVGVNTVTKEPILEDIPKTEIQVLREMLEGTIELTEEQNAALVELGNLIGQVMNGGNE